MGAGTRTKGGALFAAAAGADLVLVLLLLVLHLFLLSCLMIGLFAGLVR